MLGLHSAYVQGPKKELWNPLSVMDEIRVLLFGNPLHGDDGFGVAVGEALGERPSLFIRHVQDPVAGLSMLEGARQVIMVDAALPAGQPGRVQVFQGLSDDLIGQEQGGHESTPWFLLKAGDALLGAAMPEVFLVTGEAASIGRWRLELSTQLKAAIPEAVSAINRLIGGPDGDRAGRMQGHRAGASPESEL
jgi:hydrogenase maturation protease